MADRHEATLPRSYFMQPYYATYAMSNHGVQRLHGNHCRPRLRGKVSPCLSAFRGPLCREAPVYQTVPAILQQPTIVGNISAQRKSIPNLVKSNQIWIINTFFRLILPQTEFHLASNQSLKCNYIPNLVQFNESN